MPTARTLALQRPHAAIRAACTLVLAFVLAGCGDEPKKPPRLINFKPAIPSVEVDQSIPIAVAYERGDDPIDHFEWTVEAGEIQGNGAPEITYAAPDQAGDYELTVSVTYADEEGAVVALDTVVKVLPAKAVAPEAPAPTAAAPVEEPEATVSGSPEVPAEAAGAPGLVEGKDDADEPAAEAAQPVTEAEAPTRGEPAVTEAGEAPADAPEAAAQTAERPAGTSEVVTEAPDLPPTAREAVAATAETPVEVAESPAGAQQAPTRPTGALSEPSVEAAAAPVESQVALSETGGAAAEPEAAASETAASEPAASEVAAVAPRPESATPGPPPAAALPATSSRIDEVKARDELRAIVQIDFAPFSFYGADGRRVGFDVDMVREFARRWLGDAGKVSLLAVPTDARMTNLLNGKGDIIAAALTDTPERRQEIDFSTTYFKDGQRLLVPASSSVDDVCDLAGKKVAVIRASTSLDNLKEAAAACGFTPDLVEFRRHADAVEALIEGQVAAFTSDGIALDSFAEDGSLKVVGNHFSDEPYGFGLPKGDRRFVELVDATLAAMQADGTFAAIYQKWFGDSIAPYPLDLPAAEAAAVEVAAATTTAAPPVVEPAAAAGPPPAAYVVQPGDTLSKIAGKVWGDVGPNSWRRIYDANRALIGDDPATIEVGMKLAIPQL